ncbi:hypothetical protein A2U01_0094873, partial [Trifolium medium]|nr:hypothetical protein [Trifolium medium]
ILSGSLGGSFGSLTRKGLVL